MKAQEDFRKEKFESLRGTHQMRAYEQSLKQGKVHDKWTFGPASFKKLRQESSAGASSTGAGRGKSELEEFAQAVDQLAPTGLTTEAGHRLPTQPFIVEEELEAAFPDPPAPYNAG